MLNNLVYFFNYYSVTFALVEVLFVFLFLFFFLISRLFFYNTVFNVTNLRTETGLSNTTTKQQYNFSKLTLSLILERLLKQ